MFRDNTPSLTNISSSNYKKKRPIGSEEGRKEDVIDEEYDLLSDIANIKFSAPLVNSNAQGNYIFEQENDLNSGDNELQGDSVAGNLQQKNKSLLYTVTNSKKDWHDYLTLYSGVKINISYNDMNCKNHKIDLKKLCNHIMKIPVDDTVKNRETDSSSCSVYQYPCDPLYIGNTALYNNIPNKLYYAATSNSLQAPLHDGDKLNETSSSKKRTYNRNKNQEPINLLYYNNCVVNDAGTNYMYSKLSNDSNISTTTDNSNANTDSLVTHIKAIQMHWQDACYDLLNKLLCNHIQDFYMLSQYSGDNGDNNERYSNVSKPVALPSIYVTNKGSKALSYEDFQADNVACIVTNAPSWFIHRLKLLHCNNIESVSVDHGQDVIFELYHHTKSNSSHYNPVPIYNTLQFSILIIIGKTVCFTNISRMSLHHIPSLKNETIFT